MCNGWSVRCCSGSGSGLNALRAAYSACTTAKMHYRHGWNRIEDLAERYMKLARIYLEKDEDAWNLTRMLRYSSGHRDDVVAWFHCPLSWNTFSNAFVCCFSHCLNNKRAGISQARPRRQLLKGIGAVVTWYSEIRALLWISDIHSEEEWSS